MIKMQFITYATHSERYYPALIESFEKFNVKYTILGFGDEWKDYQQKLDSICEHLQTLDPTHIVCIMDAFDAFIYRDPTLMKQAFVDSGAKVIFSQEEVSRIFYALNWKNTSLVNAGLYIGYVESILFVISELKKLHTSGYFNDQRLLGKWISKQTSSDFRIDRENDFFINIGMGTSLEKLVQSSNAYVIGGPGYQNLHKYIAQSGLDFEETHYEEGSHALMNRIWEGEFNDEMSWAFPVFYTLLIILALILIPILACRN